MRTLVLALALLTTPAVAGECPKRLFDGDSKIFVSQSGGSLEKITAMAVVIRASRALKVPEECIKLTKVQCREVIKDDPFSLVCFGYTPYGPFVVTTDNVTNVFLIMSRWD